MQPNAYKKGFAMKKYFLPLLLLTSVSYETAQATLFPKKTLFTALVLGVATAYKIHVVKQRPENTNSNPLDLFNVAMLETAHNCLDLMQAGLDKAQRALDNSSPAGLIETKSIETKSIETKSIKTESIETEHADLLSSDNQNKPN